MLRIKAKWMWSWYLTLIPRRSCYSDFTIGRAGKAKCFKTLKPWIRCIEHLSRTGLCYNFYFSVIPANVYAYFKINGTTVATLDTATTNLNIPVNIYDILSVEIEGDISISDSVMILIDYDSETNLMLGVRMVITRPSFFLVFVFHLFSHLLAVVCIKWIKKRLIDS